MCIRDRIKRMMIKIEEPVILEGFDATLSREEGQKLTKMIRLWAQVELHRDASYRV